MGDVHDFNKCLARSHKYSDAPWWEAVYRQAFGSRIVGMHCVRQDGWAQRGGIDRQIILDCGRVITVDEKVREKDWPDIAIEYKHEFNSRPDKTGWIYGNLLCDYIAYAFVPSQRCYMFPFLNLQRAWFENRKEWKANYRDVRAQNKDYVSVSCPVPTGVLLEAIRDTLMIEWKAAA